MGTIRPVSATVQPRILAIHCKTLNSLIRLCYSLSCISKLILVGLLSLPLVETPFPVSYLIYPRQLVVPPDWYVAPTYLLCLPLLRKHPGCGGILPILELDLSANTIVRSLLSIPSLFIFLRTLLRYFAFSRTRQRTIPFVFKRFRTLCGGKNTGWGDWGPQSSGEPSVPLLFSMMRSSYLGARPVHPIRSNMVGYLGHCTIWRGI